MGIYLARIPPTKANSQRYEGAKPRVSACLAEIAGLPKRTGAVPHRRQPRIGGSPYYYSGGLR